MYGSEAWTMTSAQEDMVRKWERKTLRKIYAYRGVLDVGMWCMRTNAELYEIHKELESVTVIKSIVTYLSLIHI